MFHKPFLMFIVSEIGPIAFRLECMCVFLGVNEDFPKEMWVWRLLKKVVPRSYLCM